MAAAGTAGFGCWTAPRSPAKSIIRPGGGESSRSPGVAKGWENLLIIPAHDPFSTPALPRLHSTVEALPKPRVPFEQPQTYGSIKQDPRTSSRNWRLSLQDLDNACLQPVDFYQPVFRTPMDRGTSPKSDQYLRINHPPVIELIDNSTTWKGLAFKDCETLLFIQGYLRTCLEQLLQPQFIIFRAKVAEEGRLMSQRSCAETNASEDVLSYRFQFDQAQLCQAVLEATDASTESDGGQHDTSSEELIILYLSSLGCFIDMPSRRSERTAIDVRFRCLRNWATHSLSANEPRVTRMPDYITFEMLDVSPSEGTEIVIKPHYQANMSPRLGGPHLNVEYRIESDHPWLCWDSAAGVFKGRVPQFSQTTDVQAGLGQACRCHNQGSYAVLHLLRIEVKAIAVLAYSSSKARLERTVRARVTLRALPPAPQLVRSPSPMQSEIRCEDTVKCKSLLDFKDGGCDQDIRSQNFTAANQVELTCFTLTTCHPSSFEYQSHSAGLVSSFDLQPHSSFYGGEPTRCTASRIPEDNQDPGRHVIQADRYDKAAEILDAQYKPPSPMKRNDACRWMDATVPPKARTLGRRLSSASGAKASPDLGVEESAPGKEITSKTLSILDFLVKPGSRKVKRTVQRPTLIEAGSDKENAYSCVQKVNESWLVPTPSSSGKHGTRAVSGRRRLPLGDTGQPKFPSISTLIKGIGNRQVDGPSISSRKSRPRPKLSKDPSPQAAEKSSLLPPLEFFNSFAPLLGLPSEMSVASSDDSSNYDHDFYWTDVRNSALQKVSQTGSTTSGTVSGVLSTSSTTSFSSDDGGCDRRTRRDQLALRKVLSKRETERVIKDSELTTEETVMIFEAMKLSLESGEGGNGGGGGGSSKAMTAGEVWGMDSVIDSEDGDSTRGGSEDGASEKSDMSEEGVVVSGPEDWRYMEEDHAEPECALSEREDGDADEVSEMGEPWCRRRTRMGDSRDGA
ncbi:MAG: hypothetical protein Q9182_002722 [Xanthomendoza sp. 2 TL-2023]